VEEAPEGLGADGGGAGAEGHDKEASSQARGKDGDPVGANQGAGGPLKAAEHEGPPQGFFSRVFSRGGATKAKGGSGLSPTPPLPQAVGPTQPADPLQASPPATPPTPVSPPKESLSSSAEASPISPQLPSSGAGEGCDWDEEAGIGAEGEAVTRVLRELEAAEAECAVSKDYAAAAKLQEAKRQLGACAFVVADLKAKAKLQADAGDFTGSKATAEELGLARGQLRSMLGL